MNRGTAFKIFLPRITQGVEVACQPADIVEVRAVVQTALSRHGYRLLIATNGSEAVGIAMAHGDRIDLLITDVVMAGLSARDLAERFRHQHPAGHVLYMSGYTDDTVVQRGIREQSVEFIQKPFTPATLLRRVREVLNS